MNAPLCIACAHCVLRPTGPALCTAASKRKAERSLVTGELRPRFRWCESERLAAWIDVFLGRACGMQGKWFEPKAAADAEAA